MRSHLGQGLRRAAALHSAMEYWTIVIMTAVLVIFSLYQIALRNFFQTGIVWGDSLLRHLVLWIGFLGACRATAEGKHIQIELHALIPGGLIKGLLELVRNLFTSAVCAVLFCASWTFVSNERAAGDAAFLSLPYWWLQTLSLIHI